MNSAPPSTTLDLATATELLRRLMTLTRNLGNYGVDHPFTVSSRSRYRQICRALKDDRPPGENQLVVSFHRDQILLEGKPLEVRGPLRTLVERAQRENRGGLVLSLDLPDRELVPVLRFLAARATSSDDAPPPGCKWLSRRELLKRQRPEHQKAARNHLLQKIPELDLDEESYMDAVGALSEFMKSCATHDEARLSVISELAGVLVDRVLKEPERLMPLTTIPYYDEFTEYHSVNVCLLTLYAARLLVQSHKALQRIGRATLLHDVGKSRIPLEILYKSGRLTENEKRKILQHPVIGARMLQHYRGADPLAIAVAFGHHIKDNGRGYPSVAPDFTVGPITALVSVVDIFEALTALRPYKRPFTASQAFEFLYSMPNMASKRPYMDLLYHAIGLQPIGTRVRTSDGELGIVCGHHDDDPRHPQIRLVRQNVFGDLDTETVIVGVPAEGETVPGEETTTFVTVDPEEDLDVVG